VYGCFSTHYDKSRTESIHVVKTHRFKQKLADTSDYVFLTRRDPRDIAASAIKINLISEAEALKYVNNVIHKEYCWEKIDLEIVYEDLINNKPTYTEKIAKILNVKISAADVCEAVESLTSDDPVNHLHPNHRINGETGYYREVLSDQTIDLINNKFGKELTEWGYAI
jgi:predicted transcriptional regulator